MYMHGSKAYHRVNNTSKSSLGDSACGMRWKPSTALHCRQCATRQPGLKPLLSYNRLVHEPRDASFRYLQWCHASRRVVGAEGFSRLACPIGYEDPHVTRKRTYQLRRLWTGRSG
jgi:hypothetical protein